MRGCKPARCSHCGWHFQPFGGRCRGSPGHGGRWCRRTLATTTRMTSTPAGYFQMPAHCGSGESPGFPIRPELYIANLGSDRSQYDVGRAARSRPRPGPWLRRRPARGGGEPGRGSVTSRTHSAAPSTSALGADAALIGSATVAAGSVPRRGGRPGRRQRGHAATSRSAAPPQYDAARRRAHAQGPADGGLGQRAVVVAVSPDGGRVYVTNVDSDNVSQTTSLPGAARSRPRARPRWPRRAGPGVAVSPDGGSAYVTNAFGGTVSQYDVGADGALTPKSPATVAAGSNGWRRRPLGRTVAPPDLEQQSVRAKLDGDGLEEPGRRQRERPAERTLRLVR